jgi:hypothetical protein
VQQSFTQNSVTWRWCRERAEEIVERTHFGWEGGALEELVGRVKVEEREAVVAVWVHAASKIICVGAQGEKVARCTKGEAQPAMIVEALWRRQSFHIGEKSEGAWWEGGSNAGI